MLLGTNLTMFGEMWY